MINQRCDKPALFAAHTVWDRKREYVIVRVPVRDVTTTTATAAITYPLAAGASTRVKARESATCMKASHS